ncbi:unnamed protein product, partial [Dicrocoelium dendriticum]
MPTCCVGSTADIIPRRNLPQHDETKRAYCIPLSLHRNGNAAQFQRLQQSYPTSTVKLRPQMFKAIALKAYTLHSAQVRYASRPPLCRLVVQHPPTTSLPAVTPVIMIT